MRLLIIIDLRRAAADEDQRTLNPEEHFSVYAALSCGS